MFSTCRRVDAVRVWGMTHALALNAASLCWVLSQFTSASFRAHAGCRVSVGLNLGYEGAAVLLLHVRQMGLGSLMRSPSFKSRLPGLFLLSGVAGLAGYVWVTGAWDSETCELTPLAALVAAGVYGSQFLSWVIYEWWLGYRCGAYRKALPFRLAWVLVLLVGVYVGLTAWLQVRRARRRGWRATAAGAPPHPVPPPPRHSRSRHRS